jgi:hypothetical protein
MTKLKFFILSLCGLISSTALATNSKIICTAEKSQIVSAGELVSEKKDLSIVDESNFYILLSTDLGEKNFSFSGDLQTGIFYLSIADLPELTRGVMTTASFSKDARLQLSIVDQSTVFKLECTQN